MDIEKIDTKKLREDLTELLHKYDCSLEYFLTLMKRKDWLLYGTLNPKFFNPRPCPNCGFRRTRNIKSKKVQHCDNCGNEEPIEVKEE